MRLNKVDKIQFIYNGKQHIVKLKLHGYKYDKVPILISDDIDNCNVMLLSDNSIIIVVNSTYINNCDREAIEIDIFDKLLRYMLCTEDNLLIDIHLTQWFGVSNVIKYIENCGYSNEYKHKRIEIIKDRLLGNVCNNIHDKQYIVDNLKFVEINELEI